MKSRHGLHFGGKIDGLLIACITFSTITRKESATRLNLDSSEILELSRMAIHPQYRKKNLCSYMISRCIKSIKKLYPSIKLLITFADTTLGHTGASYKAAGFIEDGIVKPTYWYVDKNGYYRHNH